LVSVVYLFPVVWMVSTSLKTDPQIVRIPPNLIPSPVRWANYGDALRTINFLRAAKNTLYITGMNIIGNILSSSIVAYSFARLRWKGRELLFGIMLSTLMLPFAVTMVPQYLIFRNLGWVNTFKPLWVPAFFGSPFYIFLLRQFMLTLPNSYDDAARIDGCSSFGIYWRIIMPLIKPALTVVAMFTFTTHWNDFLGPLIYLSREELYTFALALQKFQSDYVVNWAQLMAASSVMTLPIIALFFAGQRYFIQGVVMSGIKG
ncbi:MAG: carbohydrate ABC transporter permease, partial [Alcaligenaceae bacterium]|nr:carbohydrate ABC transporter permease [Alcaligenaceae bacterium]